MADFVLIIHEEYIHVKSFIVWSVRLPDIS